MGKEKTCIRCQRINVVKDPIQVWFNIIKSIQYVIEVRLNRMQVTAVIEDPFEDARHVILELVQPGQNGRYVGNKCWRSRVGKVPQPIWILDQTLDNADTALALMVDKLGHGVPMPVARAFSLLHAVQLPREDLGTSR